MCSCSLVLSHISFSLCLRHNFSKNKSCPSPWDAPASVCFHRELEMHTAVTSTHELSVSANNRRRESDVPSRISNNQVTVEPMAMSGVYSVILVTLENFKVSLMCSWLWYPEIVAKFKASDDEMISQFLSVFCPISEMSTIRTSI